MKEQLGDAYGIVEFNVISDMYGTTPYYLDVSGYDIMIKRDGKMENMGNAIFYKWFYARYREEDAAQAFISVKQTEDYNGVFDQLDNDRTGIKNPAGLPDCGGRLDF